MTMAANATSSIIQVQPYLYFHGRTDEALEFYKKTLGAKVEFLMRFNESPEPCDPKMVPPGTEHKVMHASFKVGATTLMASDGGCGEGQVATFQGITLTLNVKTPEDAEQLFNALCVGGQVQMPLMKTFFSPKFGMVADKFGVSWIVIVSEEMPAR
jgi:PhnB protein